MHIVSGIVIQGLIIVGQLVELLQELLEAVGFRDLAPSSTSAPTISWACQ
jgi:hypothetical protein